MFIHQRSDWPSFFWRRSDNLIKKISAIRHLQGEISGQLKSTGFELQTSSTIEALSLEIVKSSAIEGNVLNRDDVRSSIARRLGTNYESRPVNRDIEGIVELMLDATKRYNDPLSHERLYGWQAALFPTGYSGTYKIQTAQYRSGNKELMQVVSSRLDKPVVHFVAPDDDRVLNEMDWFVKWFNSDEKTEPVLKSGLAHLHFVTIHPFEDGNGRIARAIGEMQLAKSDQSNFRFYSLSDQIEKNRKEYYLCLERTQRGDMDVTTWMEWYVDQVSMSLQQSKGLIKNVLLKAEFWIKHSQLDLSDRQRLMINKLFDGFEGKLTTSKWAKITKVSSDSALRDIADLIEKGILDKGSARSRSTHYYLPEIGDQFIQQRGQGLSL